MIPQVTVVDFNGSICRMDGIGPAVHACCYFAAQFGWENREAIDAAFADFVVLGSAVVYIGDDMRAHHVSLH